MERQGWGVGEEEGRPKGGGGGGGGRWRWILDRSGSVKHFVQHFLPDHSFSYVWRTYGTDTWIWGKYLADRGYRVD